MESVEQHLRGELLQVRYLNAWEIEVFMDSVIQTQFRIMAHVTKYDIIPVKMVGKGIIGINNESLGLKCLILALNPGFGL